MCRSSIGKLGVSFPLWSRYCLDVLLWSAACQNSLDCERCRVAVDCCEWVGSLKGKKERRRERKGGRGRQEGKVEVEVEVRRQQGRIGREQ